MLITGLAGKGALNLCKRHIRHPLNKAQVTIDPIVQFDRIERTGMKPTFDSLATTAIIARFGISAPIDPLVTAGITVLFGKPHKIGRSLNRHKIGKTPLDGLTVIIRLTRFTDKTGPSVRSQKIGISHRLQLIDRKVTNAKMGMSATIGIDGPTGSIGSIEKFGNGLKTGITGKNGRREFFALNATIGSTVKSVLTVKGPMTGTTGRFNLYSECAGCAGDADSVGCFEFSI